MQLADFTALTDVGKQREHNEDNHVVLNEIGVVAVADGMGGLEFGEVASATAVSLLRHAQSVLRPLVEAVDTAPVRGTRGQLAQALEQLSTLASLRIQQVTGGAASGTTLVVACQAGGHILVANTGDSRAYLYRRGKLRCLTVDHTVAAARLREGLITQAEHDASPYQHMLTQALGTQGEVDPDIFDEPLAAGDIVMLCSDGLTGPVSEPVIGDILGSNEKLESAARRLIDAANANGGPDNITVTLFRVTEGPSAEQLDHDRDLLRSALPLRFLGPVEHQLVRHYLDDHHVAAGEAFDTSRGLYLILEGEAQEGDSPRAPGSVLGLRAFAGEEDELPESSAVSDCRALVLSNEAYEALEVRRPRVAARLMHGLLSLAFDEPLPTE